ncbi:hypothetical protein T492DRAFT_893315 [Pavlovales sp. CCMP2436]|nr:hypothetical protein T492DRAFT_893315 [Pavlovales sp. CCMP2436]
MAGAQQKVAKVAGLLAKGAAAGATAQGFRDLSLCLSQLDDEQRLERGAAGGSEAHRALLTSAIELLAALSVMGVLTQMRELGGHMAVDPYCARDMVESGADRVLLALASKTAPQGEPGLGCYRN